MLLRGHAPQSEPFRKWVTEEVLPSIRKTGTYDLFASETEEAQQFAGDFAALHAKIEGLEAKLDAVLKAVSAPVAPIVSPYEGQPGVALCDPAGFDVRTYRELGLRAEIAQCVSLWHYRQHLPYRGPRKCTHT